MIIEWCNLCQSRPADGELELQLVEGGPVEVLNACEPCVLSIPRERWDGTK
jgi:hypothetical protein